MSEQSQALKQARHEVRAGGDRRAVFEKYKSKVPRDLKLAMIVASTPQDPIPNTARILNAVLLVLLILAALSKALTAFTMLSDTSAMPILFGILLSILLPVIFAVAVAKWEGQVYLLLPLLCLLGILRAWMKYSSLDAAIDTIFLLAIGAIAVVVKLMVFPHLGFLGVKKDGSGGYVF